MNTLKLLKAVGAVIFLLSSSLLGRTSDVTPPKPTDEIFVVDEGEGLDTRCSYRDDGPLKFDIEISRYVGDLDEHGFLKDHLTLVTNNIISDKAILRFPAYDVDYYADKSAYGVEAERDIIFFNGHPIYRAGTNNPYIEGDNGVWRDNVFEVPIEIIKFAKLSKGSVPIPGINSIEVHIDQGNIHNGEQWCMSLDWASLSFSAMPPVVLVHGADSDPKFWERRGFTEGLKELNIPYDNSIHLPRNTTEYNGDKLSEEFLRVAQKFGVKTIQVVAHSKGGLDTRYFLSKSYPKLEVNNKLKVTNFITLSTPHRGSVAANYIEFAKDNWEFNFAFSEEEEKRYELAQFFIGLWDEPEKEGFAENSSLLPRLTNELNSKTSMPSSIQCYSISADADQNGDEVIEKYEYKEMLEEADSDKWYVNLGNTFFDVVDDKMNLLYHSIGYVNKVDYYPVYNGKDIVYMIDEQYNTILEHNDIMVTHESAEYFELIPEAIGIKKNHASIGDKDVAKIVRMYLRYAK